MSRLLQNALFTALIVAQLVATGDAARIVWVGQMRGQEGEGTGVTPDAGAGTLAWEDDPWRELLVGAGHNIIANGRFDDLENDRSGLEILNSADLVIFSRDTNSGDYNSFDEQEAWTELVTVPMIIMSPFVIRNNRWDMVDSAGILETSKDVGIGNLVPLDAAHPIFAGALDANGEVDVWDEEILGPDDSIDFLDTFEDGGRVGNGVALAIESDFEVPWIIYWEAGEEFYENSVLGFTAGGPRLYYTVGSDDDPNSWGEKNTTPAGDRILLNAINFLTGGASTPGDFDGSGQLDIADINLLTTESGNGTNSPAFDLNGDSVVDATDIGVWVKDLKNTWIGDANLDGEFNSGDLVAVFSAGLFETNQAANWETGDWNGDGVFSSGDFVVAFTDGGYEQGPAPAAQVASVPEPNAAVLLALGISLIVARRRSRLVA